MSASRTGRFTGERPGWGRDFDYDAARHLAAYRYAVGFAQDKAVVDVGCGDGVGTQALAEVAASVVGFDYSADAMDACRRSWAKPNLTFHQLDVGRELTTTATFDLVVNFQVLEHMRDDLAFLKRLRALVGPGGQLLLTTPNRLQSFSENPYHLREYTATELRALLKQVFPHVTLLGMFGNALVTEFDRRRAHAVRRILRLDPLGMRKLLPAAVVTFAFARFATLVRRQARGAARERGIRPEDFSVGTKELDAALDLVAHCAG